MGQRDVGKTATVGTEIYYFSRDASDTRDRAGYNIGGVFNISDHHHLMAAAGSDFSGDTTFSLYVGYLWTFGGSEGVPKTSQSHPP